MFKETLERSRPYFPLSPTSGGEGKGEGVVVKEQTFENRIANGKHRRFAKGLRRGQTDAERAFWYQVRDRRLAGYKFKRQYPIKPYIADFVCIKAMLVVELDGGQHATQVKYDRKRDEYLKSLGFRVLRIWNGDLMTNRNGVMETVLRALRDVETHSP